MNREDIIKLAQEAGLLGPEDTAKDIIECGLELWVSGERGMQELERFAALVAAAEREACAQIAETPVGEYEVIVACGTGPVPQRIPRYLEWQSIAAAIRSRKENT